MGEAREQLGDFLRSRRERLQPEQLGLSPTRRRRTPGLRREEVAELAGISAEWYVRLEQGRAVAPSAATLDALSAVLRLGTVERDHLRKLARTTPRPAFVREEVPLALLQLMENLPHPAYVTGVRWDVLAWNPASAELFPGLARLPTEERNVLLYVLTHPEGRALFGEHWTQEARRMVALYRATHDLWADEPQFMDLVARVRVGCPEFEMWWAAHDVGAAVSGTKVLNHPARGRQCFRYASFQANDNLRLKLVVYTPVPGPSAS